MLEYKISTINHKFEDIKEEVNSGKILLYAEWEIEDLLLEANELIPLIESEQAHEELEALINQLKQYLCDIQSLIEKDCSTL